jgi:hypothetical protein
MILQELTRLQESSSTPLEHFGLIVDNGYDTTKLSELDKYSFLVYSTKESFIAGIIDIYKDFFEDNGGVGLDDLHDDPEVQNMIRTSMGVEKEMHSSDVKTFADLKKLPHWTDLTQDYFLVNRFDNEIL